MNFKSFVEVKSPILMDACIAAHDALTKRREEKLEEVLQSMMKKTRGFGSVRHPKYNSREEAIEHLKNTGDMFGSEYDSIMRREWGSEDTIDNLYGMAQLSDSVYLSMNDYEVLKDYFGSVLEID